MNQLEGPKSLCDSEVDPDRISGLPAHIVDQILSLLSIRDAVRTSVLSRKWRFMWSKVPDLVFDDNCVSIATKDRAIIKNKVVSIVDHVLLLHNGPIDSFKLSHRDFVATSDIDRWILHLSRVPIKKFILDIWVGVAQQYKLPSRLFSYENLIHLELFNCLLKSPPTFKGFQRLKSLDLRQVTMTQDVFETIVSSCFLLKSLTLKGFDGFTHLNICAPNLQFLNVSGVFDDICFQSVCQINEVLIALKKNVENDESGIFENSSKLFDFFVHLPNIRRLKVQNYFLKYLAIGDIPSRLPKPCLDLKCLTMHINFNDLEENLAALCLLRSVPNMQELEMLARQEEHNVARGVSIYLKDDYWSNLLGQLRIVRIFGISGIKSELDFIYFILSNSPVLEKMKITPASNEVSSKLTKELLRFRRASTRAEIIYMDL